MEVIIDGVRYVPDPNTPVKVTFYYMHDDHTFTKLHGTTIDEVIQKANEAEAESSGGMLCPYTLLNAKQQSVGRGKVVVHSGYSFEPKDRWMNGLISWREDVENNEDVMRLISLNGAE